MKLDRDVAIRWTAIVLMAVVLVACGGGGSGGGSGGGGSSGTAEGLWLGTTDTGRTMTGLVLDDGTYWFIYTVVGNNAVIAGVAQGTGSSNQGAFKSSNGKDFNLEGLGILNFSLSGHYTQKSSLGGSNKYSGSTTTFTAAYDPNYELMPSLASAAGSYSGSAATGGGTEFATLVVTSSGAISGVSAGGCSYTGTATPRTHGNVFNVSVTFAGGTCSNGTSTVTGVAYYDAILKQITAGALNSGRSNGFIFVGTKP
jgi:hypothetical protein